MTDRCISRLVCPPSLFVPTRTKQKIGYERDYASANKMVRPGGGLTLQGSRPPFFRPLFLVPETNHFKLFFSSRSRPHLHLAKFRLLTHILANICSQDPSFEPPPPKKKRKEKTQNKTKPFRVPHFNLGCTCLYQKCVWMPLGWSSSRKRPKKRLSGMKCLKN